MNAKIIGNITIIKFRFSTQYAKKYNKLHLDEQFRDFF